MPKVVHRYFILEDGTRLPVTIGDDGYVNVAATGCMDAKTFAELAHSILAVSNLQCGTHQGLPSESRELE